MPLFTINIPGEAPEWISEFNSQLSKCFESISMQMDNLDSKLSGKFDALRAAVKSELSDIKNIANDAHNMAIANAAAIESVNKRVFNMERKSNGLANKCKRLTELCESQDTYSRRENLVIRGVDEGIDETDDICMNTVTEILVQKMNIDKADVDRMTIVRCHRLGRKDNSGIYKRPIIVRFLDYNDWKFVWGKRMVLANTAISISEIFANSIEHRRKLLYPIMKKAKASDKYQKAYLKSDKLVLDNVEYSLTDGSFCDLPADLNPEQFSCKSSKEWTIFGGPHSVFNPLSNFYPEPITYKDITHDTLEHAYQYAKASKYEDTAAEEAILCATTPAEAKQAGFRVRNFDHVDWDKSKKKIMLDLLRVKFAKDSELSRVLLKTAGRSIAEAGKSKSFSIGLPLYSRNIFDTSKWPKNSNILGKCLMEIRRELSDN